MIIPTPFSQARAITKSDTVDFDVNLNGGLSDAIYVGGAGIVVAVFQDGSTANFTAVAGQVLPLRIKRVNSGTTTATLMVALYSV